MTASKNFIENYLTEYFHVSCCKNKFKIEVYDIRVYPNNFI